MKKTLAITALSLTFVAFSACQTREDTTVTETGTTAVTETTVDTTATSTLGDGVDNNQVGDGVDNNQVGDGKDNNNIGDGKDNPQISPELKQDAKEAGQAVGDAARTGVAKTGEALQKAGTKLKDASKPGDQNQ